MREMSPAELLDVWERGRRRPSLDQGTLLLWRAWPELSWDALEAMPLGRRESLLLALRQRLFGSRLTGLANCPECGTALEFSLELPSDSAAVVPAAGAEMPEASQINLSIGEYTLEVRVPVANDLRRAAAENQPPWSYCVTRLERLGQPVASEELPAAAVAELEAALQAADPLALIEVSLTCPACSRGWNAPLDTAAYLFRELDAWAHETLWTIHQLASAYGWGEAEILGLPAWRRQYYLELAER